MSELEPIANYEVQYICPATGEACPEIEPLEKLYKGSDKLQQRLREIVPKINRCLGRQTEVCPIKLNLEKGLFEPQDFPATQ